MIRVDHSALFLRGSSVIMGDDGFGPAVMEELKTGLPPDRLAAGSGVRGRIFDCLPAPATRKESFVFRGVIDSPGHEPGLPLCVDVSLLPAEQIHNPSLRRSSPINLCQDVHGHAGICIAKQTVQVALMAEESPFGSSLSGDVSPACEKIVQPLFASERTPGE